MKSDVRTTRICMMRLRLRTYQRTNSACVYHRMYHIYYDMCWGYDVLQYCLLHGIIIRISMWNWNRFNCLKSFTKTPNTEFIFIRFENAVAIKTDAAIIVLDILLLYIVLLMAIHFCTQRKCVQINEKGRKKQLYFTYFFVFWSGITILKYKYFRYIWGKCSVKRMQKAEI